MRRWSPRRPAASSRAGPSTRSKLTRRGIDILPKRPPTLLQRLTVDNAAQPLPEPMPGGLALALVADRFAQCDEEAPPVLDAEGQLKGVIRLGDVTDALASSMPAATASDPVSRHGSLGPGSPLDGALERLVAAGGALPVERGERRGPVRWIRERDALQAYTAAARATSTEPLETRPDV